MTEPRRMRVRVGRKAWGTLLVSALLLSVLFRQQLRSVERGNRLYRGGDPSAAAEIYRHSLGDDERALTTLYNLGTALLFVDPDSADGLLRSATEAEDRTTAQRGFYNLGYRLLTAAVGAPDPDSTVATLRRAVESNRWALRLDPTDQSARWNLALAQRRLDALAPPGEEVGRESAGESEDEIAMNDPSLARSETAAAESGLEPEDPREADNIGERQGAREGAREAWAAQDPGPLTTEDAFELLAGVIDEPESLLRGLLWSHRPDVAWWSGQPYPGGPW